MYVQFIPNICALHTDCVQEYQVNELGSSFLLQSVGIMANPFSHVDECHISVIIISIEMPNGSIIIN